MKQIWVYAIVYGCGNRTFALIKEPSIVGKAFICGTLEGIADLIKEEWTKEQAKLPQCGIVIHFRPPWDFEMPVGCSPRRCEALSNKEAKKLSEAIMEASPI